MGVNQWDREVLGFDWESELDSTCTGPQSIAEIAHTVLHSTDMKTKVIWTLYAHRHRLTDDNKLPLGAHEIHWRAPDKPGRPEGLEELSRGNIQHNTKGWERKRLSMIHAFAHIESYAIDLSWDIILRFGLPLGDEFVDDWIKVAVDEARHFSMWETRLHDLDSHYGALPVHDGLWKSASATATGVLERLAIVHMVHEAHGLDVAPRSIQKLENWRDFWSSNLLFSIYKDEVSHVATAVKWYKRLSPNTDEQSMISSFQESVKRLFDGSLKPPFNEEARIEAGFTPAWYEALSEQ